MEILYKNKKLKKTFESSKELVKSYGDRMAKKIVQRMNELIAAESLFDIRCNPSARLHLLDGNYKNNFAIDLVHPYRLIIQPGDGEITDVKTIKIVEIIKVIDYH